MVCISSKMAYRKLIQPLSKPPTSQLYFEKMLGFGKVEWGKVYMLPRIVTIESSLRSFQYKILKNILYLNERLFKFNIVNSPLCSLCGAYNESIKHLFCTCTVTVGWKTGSRGVGVGNGEWGMGNGEWGMGSGE